jgi:hypothetical protein
VMTANGFVWVVWVAFIRPPLGKSVTSATSRQTGDETARWR